MRFALTMLVALAVQPVLARTAAAQAGQSPQPDIVKIADAYVKASLAGDAKAIAALYAEDAIEMPPHQPMIKGRAAIEQYYQKQIGAAKLTSFVLTHLDTRASGDIAFDVGTYRQAFAPSAGAAASESGKYTVTLRRVGGEWKVTSAIYNSDSPPPASATQR